MSNYYGSSRDYFVQRLDDSKAHKIKSAYWTTKQAMISKFGRKEDANIVASDSDLDAKLMLLKSVKGTCRDLTRLLIRYQDIILFLSQCESEMGRFLKQYSLEDKTQAGKIMSAVGKALSNSAQQRLLLRTPLERLQQEVLTFRQRGISDTMSTLKKMETARTEYRGALLWMKKVSEELDPDTYKQLEKFRCVQAQVRKNKEVFDRLKIDSMQKIDLLSTSRCNMLSHVLAAYQNSLVNFFEKTSRTMVAVADRFKGYQYYEFAVLKHLRSESKKLSSLSNTQQDTDEHGDGSSRPATPPPAFAEDEEGVVLSEEELDRRLEEVFQQTGELGDLLQFNNDTLSTADQTKFRELFSSFKGFPASLEGPSGEIPSEHRDLFADLFAVDEESTATAAAASSDVRTDSEFSARWDSLLMAAGDSVTGNTDQPLGVLPSQLLDSNASDLSSWTPFQSADKVVNATEATSLANGTGASGSTDGKQLPANTEAWLSLFADLDPLANPDQVSKQAGQISEV